MGVCANHSRNLTIEKASDGNLFTRGFAVNVDEDDVRLSVHFRDRRCHGVKGIFQNWQHKCARLHIDYAHFPFRRLQNDRPVARRAFRVIDRAQKPRLGIDVSENVFLIPNVIACRHDRHTGT